MIGTEAIAYAIASIALTISCALFLLASRAGPQYGPETVGTDQASRLASYFPRLGTAMAAMAALALLIGLAARGTAAGRWPLGSPFEFTLSFAACVVLLCLPLLRTAQAPVTGAIATVLALALVVHAFFVQPEAARAIQSLPPVMGSVWFSLHTLLTAIAYGGLGIAGSLALGSLVLPGPPAASPVDRGMDVGYVALSLGMIAGGIWGEQAWGDYWSWSTKETWTLITWWVCTFYSHVRRRRGWRGRPAMGIAVLALVAVLVTFLGTPTLVRWTRLERLRIY